MPTPFTPTSHTYDRTSMRDLAGLAICMFGQRTEDLVRTDVPVLSERLPLGKVLAHMQEATFGYCYLTDEDGRLTGTFTESDICRKVYPVIERHDGKNPLPIFGDEIRHYMHRDPYAVKADFSTLYAARIMESHSVRRVPVVCSDNRVIGGISTRTILYRLLQECQKHFPYGLPSEGLSTFNDHEGEDHPDLVREGKVLLCPLEQTIPKSYEPCKRDVLGVLRILSERAISVDMRTAFDAIVVEHDQLLWSVAGFMRNTRKGYCYVKMKETNLYGIFTEKDLLNHVVGSLTESRGHPSAKDILDIEVGNLATARLHTAHANGSLYQALVLFHQGHFRRLPIMETDVDGFRLVADLSQRGIFSALTNLFRGQVASGPEAPRAHDEAAGMFAQTP